MKEEYSVIRDIPFFTHLKKNELFTLNESLAVTKFKTGEIIDLKKTNYLYIIIDGVLELQSTTGKSESVYLTSGDFFGDILFTEKHSKSHVKALTDSVVFELKREDTYRLFLSSYKAARGYIKSIDRLGFELTDTSRKHFENNTKIITITGEQRKSGKSYIASLISASLAETDKVILLDLSYEGNSVFNSFGQKLIPAISAREEDENFNSESWIFERIVDVSDNLALLNIAFGAKVKMSSEIISPIIFLLSKIYKFIVIDYGGSDKELESKVYKCSDYILAIAKNKNDIVELSRKYDDKLDDAQKVYYLLNCYYVQNVKKIDGGYLIDNFDLDDKNSVHKHLEQFANNKVFKELIQQLQSKRKSLILTCDSYEAIAYSGLYSIMLQKNITFDYIFSAFLGYIVSAFYVSVSNKKEFEKLVTKFFNEKRIESLLDVVFPENSVFKNGKVYKFFRDIFNNKRIEYYNSSIVCNLMDNNNLTRTFSTGFLAKLATASFLNYPIFESIGIGSMKYHSGMPYIQSLSPDIFRNDSEEFISCSINYQKRYNLETSKMPFYSEYLKYHNRKKDLIFKNKYEKNIVIDVNFDTNNDIFKESEDKWSQALEENGVLIK